MDSDRNPARPNKRKVLLLISALNVATHQGVARAARDFGWYLDLSFVARARLPSSWNGDGILCSLADHPEMDAFIRDSTLAVVDISIYHSEIALPRVVADNEKIGGTAASHLAELEHQHFAWFALRRDAVGEARLAGYAAAISRRVHRLDGRGADDRQVVAKKLKALPRPCAIFAKTDVDAAWIMSLCLEEGYNIPDDFAVVGVDNNPLICDYLQVPLTSVNHDLELLGHQAACLLNDLMEGGTAPSETMLIPPHGVTPRASTDGFAVQDELVRTALAFMKDHLSKEFGTQQIADALGVSRRTLEIRFRDVVGATVHDKQMELRLSRAEHLLRTTADTAETIAAVTGFCHAQHLSRLFKARYGHPPLRYRKTMLQ